jgi:C4-dicarboxylate transporter DctQ subunit
LASLLRLLDWIENFAMAFFMSAALVVGTSQVVARYVFNEGVVWSEQAFVKFTIWAALIGASRAARDGLHVRVDLVLDRLPPAVRRPVELCNIAITLAFCGVTLWAAVAYFDFLMMVGTMNIETGVPEWLAFAVTPLFLALMIVRYLALVPAAWRSPSGDPWKADGAGSAPAPSAH